MDKQPLPQALREHVERDGLSLDALAAHNGVSAADLARDYDLGGVPFKPAATDEAPQLDTLQA